MGVEAVLSPGVKEALTRFHATLRERFPARLREVVLFGSHARGTTHEESDVDILVVIDDLTESERSEVIRIAYDIDREGDDWLGLSPVVMSTAHAADLRRRERLLLREIDGEGIVL